MQQKNRSEKAKAKKEKLKQVKYLIKARYLHHVILTRKEHQQLPH